LTAGSHGNVRANGNITLSGGSTVKGDATAGGTVSSCCVTGTTTQGAPPLLLQSVPACGPPYSSASGITGGNYITSTGAWTISGGGAGTLCFSSITISGGSSTLSVSSPVTIYVTAATNLSGGSVANTTLNASNLKISSLNAPSNNNGVVVSGGGQAYMSVYAPDTGVTVSGGSDFYGSLVGYKIVPSGGSKIHYDQASASVLGPGVVLSAWHEVRN
jgi:hypothetical protein